MYYCKVRYACFYLRIAGQRYKILINYFHFFNFYVGKTAFSNQVSSFCPFNLCVLYSSKGSVPVPCNFKMAKASSTTFTQ